ncbi:MAG: 2-oxoacid:acceptor oxidoreductase family protein, partial [Thermococcus sp.]
NIITTNVVLIGALTQTPGFPLSAEHVREVIKVSVPKKAVDVNMKAFDLGIKAAKEMLGL